MSWPVLMHLLGGVLAARIFDNAGRCLLSMSSLLSMSRGDAARFLEAVTSKFIASGFPPETRLLVWLNQAGCKLEAYNQAKSLSIRCPCTRYVCLSQRRI